MSQDHFVAQTYLKHFGDDTRGGMLHAYRKKDGKCFPCWPKDVCREWDGDINRLLAHPELLGDFRRIAEPFWNASVASVLGREISFHDKFVVATYTANLMTCTPGWRRVGVSHHNQHYRARLNLLKEAKERRSEPPDLLEEGIEMIERGELAFDTDPDYIKALVTKSLMQYAWHIYNQDWTVLRNHSMQPFVTSDNPVAMAYSGAAGDPVRRFLPITPHLCVGIRFDPHADPAGERLTPKELEAGLLRPPRGSIVSANCGVDLAKYINRVQAQSAEELVFSSALSEGIGKLVRKYANYRMDIQVVQFRDTKDDGIVTGSILSVREFHE